LCFRDDLTSTFYPIRKAPRATGVTPAQFIILISCLRVHCFQRETFAFGHLTKKHKKALAFRIHPSFRSAVNNNNDNGEGGENDLQPVINVPLQLLSAKPEAKTMRDVLG
jgi:hypothetical protein